MKAEPEEEKEANEAMRHVRLASIFTFLVMTLELTSSTCLHYMINAMTTIRLAAVMGATRGQGLSVINALLQTGRYSIRGITNDASTPEAHRLRERGVDVVAVDLDQADSITAALCHANVVFAGTTMYDGVMGREIQQGKRIAQAAAAMSTVEHFVRSTLPSASTLSAGKIRVPHMDGKAEVDEFIINSLPALAQKATFYWGGLYAENVTHPSYRPNFLETAQKYAWIQLVEAFTIVPMVGDHTINTGLCETNPWKTSIMSASAIRT